MIKAFFIFTIIFCIFFAGIYGFQTLTGKEKMKLAKVLTYSFGCATLTLSVLVLIVFLF